MSAYQSETITELAKALLNVQRQLQPVSKDSENPFTKSWYASLKSVMAACRDALFDNGTWLCQYPVPVENPGHLGLVTRLTHAESGQWQGCLAVAPLPKNDPQGYGSCISYLRRYTLCAMLGIVTEDDDAEGAKKPAKHTESARRSRNAPQTLKGPSDKVIQASPLQVGSKPMSNEGGFSGIPRIDGISYQTVTAQNGKPCIIATGKTTAKKELLAGAGFRWNADRKIWWRYADAS